MNSFTPDGHPINSEPVQGPGYQRTTDAEREEALTRALRGIEKGAWDVKFFRYVLRFFDDPSLRTLISWLERSRTQGMIGALDLEERVGRNLPHNRRASDPHHGGELLRGGAGFSGPGHPALPLTEEEDNDD